MRWLRTELWTALVLRLRPLGRVLTPPAGELWPRFRAIGPTGMAAGRPPRQSRYIYAGKSKPVTARHWPWARGGGGAIGNSRESTRSGKDADSPWRLCATHIAALLPDHTVPRTLACCPNMGQAVACGRCLPQTAPRPGKMAGALRPSTFSPRARTPPRSARSVRKRRISGRSARTRVRSRGGREKRKKGRSTSTSYKVGEHEHEKKRKRHSEEEKAEIERKITIRAP